VITTIAAKTTMATMNRRRKTAAKTLKNGAVMCLLEWCVSARCVKMLLCTLFAEDVIVEPSLGLCALILRKGSSSEHVSTQLHHP
jgi:hypothetical protein